MAGGRPPEYDPVRTVDRAQAYLDAPRSEKVKIPTLEGLAIYLNISRATIYDWKDKYTEFSDIVEKVLTLQAQGLIENGLVGEYNPTITKLMLTKHGYVDKQEITGKDGSPLIDEQAKARGNAAIAAVLGKGNTEQGE